MSFKMCFQFEYQEGGVISAQGRKPQSLNIDPKFKAAAENLTKHADIHRLR